MLFLPGVMPNPVDCIVSGDMILVRYCIPQMREVSLILDRQRASNHGGCRVNGARLLVVQGVDQGRRFEVDSSPMRIGRGVQNEIRVLDSEVSRRHAVLNFVENQWTISDAGSSNGTFVNGELVQTRPLSSGDQIQVGRTILLFTDHADDAEGEEIQIDLAEGPDDASQIVGSISQSLANRLEPSRSAALFAHSHQETNLEVLYRVSEEVVRPSVSIDQILKRVLDLSLQALGADRGIMFIADSRTDQIEPRVVSTREGMSVSDQRPVSRTIVEYVIEHGKGVHTSDAVHDERFEDGQSILKAGIREAMCVPIQGRYELLGVLYVDTTSTPSQTIDRQGQNRFSTDLLTLLAAIGRQSALAVENHRYQQALVSAERLAAVGQAVAALGHDVKNILQGMRGGTYLIQQGLEKDNTQFVHQGWGILERNQDRIYNLVTDMLSFSKDRPPQWEMAQLNQTTSDVCDLLAQRAADQKTRLERFLDETLPPAQFDPTAIHRAILNIVMNALDAVAGTEDALVTVTTSFDPDENLLRVTVEDNGPGIPSEELPHLFEFFSSSKGARGTGLGLAVSRKILREHGGDIHVETAPDGGARFRLEWPFHEEEEARSLPVPTPLEPGKH